MAEVGRLKLVNPPTTDPMPHTAVSTPAIAGLPRSRAQAMITMSIDTSDATMNSAVSSASTSDPSRSSVRPPTSAVRATGWSIPARRNAPPKPNAPSTASAPHNHSATCAFHTATTVAANAGPTTYMTSCMDASTVNTADCAGPVARRGKRRITRASVSRYRLVVSGGDAAELLDPLALEFWIPVLASIACGGIIGLEEAICAVAIYERV